MTWVLIAATVWPLLACGVALLVARAVHLADEHTPHALMDVDRLLSPSEFPQPVVARLPGPRRPARARRRTGTPVS